MTSQRISLSRVSISAVLLLSWITIANAQSANPKPKPNGSIAGRVTVDGKAAAGIPIAAVAGETVNRRDAAAKAVSDVEGYYLISGLGPGQYQIWTLTPSMIAEPGEAPLYFSYSGTTKSIILGANEDVQGVDLKLIRGAVITGRVTNADNKPVVAEPVSVQLLDANGAPRMGAVPSRNDEMSQTDDRGIYRIFGLPPGRYKVSVGYDPADGILRGQRRQKTFYPDTIDPSKAAIVELREADEATHIDIKVDTAPPTYVVSGKVIDSESGLPIPKAGVSFMIVPKAGPAAPGFGIQADERGQFGFSGFSPGRYAAYPTSQFYGGNFYGDPVYFEVTDKDVTGIELKTVPGLSISGVIVADGMSTKDLLTSLPGLNVQARGALTANDRIGSGGNSAVRPDGSFQIDGLRPGRVSFTLFSSNVGFSRAVISRIEHDGIGLDQGFDIQQSVSGLRLVINYGTGIIRGVVKLEGDTPIANVQMYASCKREGAREGTGAPVDARGHFLIKNLSPGSYEVTIQVRAIGGPSPPHRPVPPPKELVTVTNGSESEVTFVVDVRPREGGP